MPLRKSPSRTPAFLAANRRNALKSTGPRTPRGKARVSLNALKSGRYAVRLPERLLALGERRSEAQYRWFRSQIAQAFRPCNRVGCRRRKGWRLEFGWRRARRRDLEQSRNVAHCKELRPHVPLPSPNSD